MLTRLGAWALGWAGRRNPWTDVYGVSRSILALGTALTLIFNATDVLFRPAAGVPSAPLCRGLGRISLFCLFSSGRLEIARWISVAVLLVVVSGYRPRLTGLLHWWIAFSLQASAITLDGGDQVGAVLSLLLLPVTLTDPRRWHWQRVATDLRVHRKIQALVALSALFMIRLQVAGIYFHAAIGKFAVPEWADGTVLYYWFSHPTYGAARWLQPIIDSLIHHGPSLAALTWGSMILEVFLFAALVMPKKSWKILLVLGIVLHVSIAVIHGLVSFGLAMVAALTLYLRPTEMPLVSASLRKQFAPQASLRAALRTPASAEAVSAS